MRNVIHALNTGETTRVSEFIGSNYFNHESQMDPVRSKMRGPQEFIDTVVNIRKAFSDLHYKLLDSVASNEKVISIVSVKGKHRGSIQVAFSGSFHQQGTKYLIKQYIYLQLAMER
ncbi:MAG TPA: ester cyclase [Nitrososphaeraceae archaeon]|nr:ester cyclase [Nitrososphaeraceae archaeon]